jgi:Kef-type K+ transport system membrane component KefB
MKRNTLFYIVVTSVFVFLLWLILKQGHSLESGRVYSTNITNESSGIHPISITTFFQHFRQNLQHSLAILILQIISIVLIARLLGWLMIKLRQPVVIGEIMAGILLGPSLLGTLFPGFSAFLFPVESFNNLQILSQIGLIMFMFIIGMELDLAVIRRSAASAIVISHASIVFPYFLGVGLAYFLYANYAPANITFMAFALFMGIAMSITAFPVLARIVQERNLTKTELGALAITCAAVDDVTAWCLLAIVIAIVKAGEMMGAYASILLTVAYILFMFYLVKPVLAKVANKYFTRETIHKNIVALIFAFLLLSSFLTEVIGIHALFGAFLAGVVMPSNSKFRMVFAQKIEDFSLVLLLPLFFVLTGLRTQIGLLNEPHLWMVCFVVILIAIAGKLVGGSFAARFVGQTWKDSLLLGTLMNTRGLMELIVLNIGYELGILSAEIFAMLVLMALTTTLLTGPLIQLINYIFNHQKEQAKIVPEAIPDYSILISFGSPETGKHLVNLASQLNFRNRHAISITALHLTPSTDFSIREAEIFEKESFEPILLKAAELNINIHTQYKATNDVDREIIQFANNGHYDLMLVGSSRPLFSTDETGGKARYFFEDVNCSVGVLIDKGINGIENVLLIIDNPDDLILAKLAGRFVDDNSKHLTVLDNNSLIKDDYSIFDTLPENKNSQISLVSNLQLNRDFINHFKLVIISVTLWNIVRNQQSEWLNYSPSILVVNPKAST